MKCQVCGDDNINGICENADDNGESQDCSGACAYGHQLGPNVSLVVRLCDSGNDFSRGCLSGVMDEVSDFSALHSVWKSPKMSHLNFSILAFSTIFCPIKTDLSGNSVWPQASDFQKLAKMNHFWHI